MSPSLINLNRTAHIIISLSWIGTVIAFFAISIVGLTSHNIEIVRGSYYFMDLISLYTIIPISVLAFLTGLIQSLGTSWGLFRYYWIILKFVLTIAAVGLLLLHQFKLMDQAAAIVELSPAGTMPNVGGSGKELMTKSGLAIFLLVGIAILGIYKPWSQTSFGHREDKAQENKKAGFKVFLILLGLLGALFIGLHLTSHSPMMHNH